MEKFPKEYSLEEFLNTKAEEERIEDSKRSDYSAKDGLEHLYSSNKLKRVLHFHPERTSLVEKLFNPDYRKIDLEVYVCV